jgi:hypothetical protein
VALTRQKVVVVAFTDRVRWTPVRRDVEERLHPAVRMALDVTVQHPGASAHRLPGDELEPECVSGTDGLVVDDPGVVKRPAQRAGS